jgi:hypothetical protein
VTQRVRREPLAFQAWAGSLSDRGVLGEQPLDGMAAERTAVVAGGEQRVGGSCSLFVMPGAYHGCGLAGERGDALLSSFPFALNVRGATEMHVLASRAD